MSNPSNSIVVSGSMADIAKRENMPLAETWLNCAIALLCDTSGSMYMTDSRNGQSRYDVMIEELQNIQKQYPGRVAVIGFSGHTEWYPNGIPYFEGGMTDLAGALQFIQPVDGTGCKITVISDGCPDSETAALAIAREFTTQIDTIYVGPENDSEGGRAFLRKLARATSGTHQDDFRVNQLGSRIAGLLNG